VSPLHAGQAGQAPQQSPPPPLPPSPAAKAALEAQAAALLDATPRAHSGPAALLLHPWTVGDRRPSRFYFTQLEQLVLFLLTLLTAFNAGRTAGSGSAGAGAGAGAASAAASSAAPLPYAQALTLQALLLALVLACTALQAFAALRLNQFKPADAWKRGAQLGVLALTALAGALNFSAWAGAPRGLMLTLASLLFAGVLVLVLYLARSFVGAVEAAARQAGEDARASGGGAAAAAAAAAAGTAGRAGAGASTTAQFFVRNPLVAGVGAAAGAAGKAGAAGAAGGAQAVAAASGWAPQGVLGRARSLLQGGRGKR
jgi:hypothetical protein